MNNYRPFFSVLNTIKLNQVLLYVYYISLKFRNTDLALHLSKGYIFEIQTT